MKTINNFDKSSTGVDVEFTGGYDTVRSQWLFEESLEVVKYEGYRSFSILYYIDYGNVSGHKDVDFEIIGNKENFAEYLVYHFAYESKSGYMKWKKDDLYNEVSDHLWDEMSLENYRSLNQEIEDFGLKVVPTKNLVWLESRGYSQGDYAEAVYCTEDLAEAWGRMPTEEGVKEEIDHLLWDAPISATITVDGEEFHYDEVFDWYDWQREEFIEYVSKRTGVDKEVLGAIVPQDLDYN